MAKWLAVGAVLMAALGGVLWQLRGRSAQASGTAPAVEKVAAPAPAPAPPAPVPVKMEPNAPRPNAPPDQKMDPRSEEFITLVDDQLPVRLLSVTAGCDPGGQVYGDEKVRLHVDISISKGIIFVRDVKVLLSTVTDKALEKCIVDAVKGFQWPEDRAPDWTGDDQLLVRVNALRKYREDLQDAEEED